MGLPDNIPEWLNLSFYRDLVTNYQKQQFTKESDVTNASSRVHMSWPFRNPI